MEEVRTSAHESFSREEAGKPSERSFGIVFAVMLALIGLWPAIRLAQPRYLVLLAAGALLLIALLAPQWLKYPNQLWHRFGLVLHKIVSPLVLGLIFFTTVVPTAWWMRLRGRDPLRLQRDDRASTYWITRTPPGPDAKSMTAQF